VSHRDDLGASDWPPGPTGDLLLAQALEACLRAERNTPGSAEQIIARQPAAARVELRQLFELAQQLEGSMAGIRPSAEFTRAARVRLMQRIGHEHAGPVVLGPLPRRRRRHWKWIVRTSSGLLAAVLATAATLTASASALPGDPLYGLKQAQEELSLRLAADDQARVLALLRTADARLDETARLLQQGRTSEALVTAQRYDQSVERATTALVVSLAPSQQEAGQFEPLDSRLGEQQQRLETMIQTAPEPARPDLREALATTSRGRELMADPQPVERALGLRQSHPVLAAAVPTSHAEEMPTRVPTQRPVVVAAATLVPIATAIVAQAENEAAEVEADEPQMAHRENERGGAQSPGATAHAQQTNNRGSGLAGRPPSASSSTNRASEDNRDGRDNEDAVAVQPSGQGGHDANTRGNGSGQAEQESGRNQDGNDDRRDDQPVVARQAPIPPPAASTDSHGSGSNSGSGSIQGRSSGRDGNDGLASNPSTRSGTAQQSDRVGAAAARDDGRSGSGAWTGGAKPTPAPTVSPHRATTDDQSQKSGGGSGGSTSKNDGRSTDSGGDH
jgi:Domain of unknown function (DUF5667)